jgi:hypothetical protein
MVRIQYKIYIWKGESQMDEGHANWVARALGGLAWHSGDDEWLVLFERADGKLVVLSNEVVCEYDNTDAFEDTKPIASIMLH